jgi:hypothetical protein
MSIAFQPASLPLRISRRCSALTRGRRYRSSEGEVKAKDSEQQAVSSRQKTAINYER